MNSLSVMNLLRPSVYRVLRIGLLALLGILCVPCAVRAQEPSPSEPSSGKQPTVGATIYRAQCADCHGPDGQGGSATDRPLFGDDTIAQLADRITRTMPEGAPDECVGEQANEVAKYVFDAFYSRAARQALGLASAPRRERMRLTVPQHRNAIADVIASFTPAPKSPRSGAPEKGLWAEYYESEKMTKTQSKKIERVDPFIDFDFGTEAPKDTIDKTQFAIIWDGSINIRDTGYYQFKVRTPNGFRLYVNLDYQPSRRGLRDDASDHGQSALIDGWVSDGQLQEKTARIFLLGGRRYPIRLEFFKYQEENAAIHLSWKTPHDVWRRLDENHLTTEVTTRTFVVDTPFPPDDRSLGYERGTSISRQWQAATNQAAVAAANEVVARLPLLAGVHHDSEDAAQRLRAFVVRLAAVAWRRPLREEETRALQGLFEGPTADPVTATKRAVVYIFQSPFFLYTELASHDQTPSQYVIASRIAWSVWDSVPDAQLVDAARNSRLGDADQVATEVRRMIEDPRARSKLRAFFRHWLEFDERDRQKNASEFPEFDAITIADLRYSLEQFIDEVVWSESSDYRNLLLADYLWLNAPLRKIYAARESRDKQVLEFVTVTLANQQRSGVLTHPYLLSAQAYADSSSPIHRGVFLTRNIVGRGLKAPPEAIAFKDSDFAPELTMREKITQLTSSTGCMTCHSIINPLGFALENYDAIGRYRTTEDERPINTVSQYVDRNGKTVQVRSARDVAEHAIHSRSAQNAFITQLFHHSVKQDPLAYGRDALEKLRAEFVANNFHILDLWVAVTTQTALHDR